MTLLLSTLKKSLKASPFVFKKVSVYFGFYFLALSFPVLFFLQQGFFPENNVGVSLPLLILALFSKVFTVFIVPYYVFEYNKKSSRQKFWAFIRDKVWPLTFNHIKAFFVILFYSLLLIIPGLYKAVRLTFLTETVFFDEKLKENSVSALKQADKVTRGHFFLVALISVLVFVCFLIYLIISVWLKRTLFYSLPVPLENFLSLIIEFYMSCFFLLFKAQFYFELKKQRGEAVSL